ncbi:hypothetical protein DFH06DRAFT_1117909 [Mycena polygramma]|nr:hypothetical protein DFH06DRAFT_1117909 [Mycena polygramma]
MTESQIQFKLLPHLDAGVDSEARALRAGAVCGFGMTVTPTYASAVPSGRGLAPTSRSCCFIFTRSIRWLSFIGKHPQVFERRVELTRLLHKLDGGLLLDGVTVILGGDNGNDVGLDTLTIARSLLNGLFNSSSGDYLTSACSYSAQRVGRPFKRDFSHRGSTFLSIRRAYNFPTVEEFNRPGASASTYREISTSHAQQLFAFYISSVAVLKWIGLEARGYATVQLDFNFILTTSKWGDLLQDGGARPTFGICSAT